MTALTKIPISAEAEIDRRLEELAGKIASGHRNDDELAEFVRLLERRVQLMRPPMSEKIEKLRSLRVA